MSDKDDMYRVYPDVHSPDLKPPSGNTESREREAIARICRKHVTSKYLREYNYDYWQMIEELTTYTANKQRLLLEWVEQEVVGPDDTGWTNFGKRNLNSTEISRNELRAAQRKQIKNKKESL